MQDQCRSINNHASSVYNRDVACFLGSSQLDKSIEQKAWNGEFIIIYLTPEKLVNCLDKLSLLHTRSRFGIGLLAIDEAHCVSEWGHDFRPSFRDCSKFRATTVLKDIPTVVLTATSTHIIRNDILHNLMISRSSYCSVNSVDRQNLLISIRPKLKTTNNEIIKLIKDIKKGGVVIYCPTVKQVDETVIFLDSNQLSVRGYHSELCHQERQFAHESFLTGSIQIIVATLAFGMGIDKPNIRLVIHLGDPKSMADYYQQIGRAGRDGLESQCILFHSDATLSNYASSYYTKNLNEKQNKNYFKEIDVMRKFVNTSECFRRQLMVYYNETPTFNNCNNCGNCIKRKDVNFELERDFSIETRILLKVILTVAAGKGKRKTIEAAITEGYDYLVTKYGKVKKNHFEVLAGFLCKLADKGYIYCTTKSVNINDFSTSYTEYSLTHKGKEIYSKSKVPIILEIPDIVKRKEKLQKEELKKNMDELLQHGIDPNGLDESSLNSIKINGQDSFILKFHNAIKRDRINGFEERANGKEELLKRILEWRDKTASILKISTDSVCSEDLARKIAYTQISSKEHLFDSGLRSKGIDELSIILKDSILELFPTINTAYLSHQVENKPTKFPSLPIFPFKKTIPKQTKKTPAWFESIEKFKQGISIAAIAIDKQVLPTTIISHILDAFKYNHSINFQTLISQCNSLSIPPPSLTEWSLLIQACITSGNTSPEKLRYALASLASDDRLLFPVYKREFNDIEKDKRNRWFYVLKWFSCMKETETQMY
jgi:RecQ family ATP-dependent DNA helicase